MRIELPDQPGSLGRVASAIGAAGADIEVLEIVEHRPDGTAVDDVILEFGPGVLADAVVSACHALDGVKVLWINRYAGSANLFRDLELVETLSQEPHTALDRLVEMLPDPFRANWAARVNEQGVVALSDCAPSGLTWLDIDRATRLAFDNDVTAIAAAPLGSEVVMIGRDGGPEFLDSELARLAHLATLARTLSRSRTD